MDHAARDDSRRAVAARGLTPAAVAHLAQDALGRIELEHLTPVKGLLKRFFSDAPWTGEDDDALADLVGPGTGWWDYELDSGFELAFGWRDGRFRLELASRDDTVSPPEAHTRRPVLDDMFDGTVVPEATPNPRTIRFVTGELGTGESRWYESAAQADDPRVGRLFAEFDDVANVLVGPNFVAIGVRRPDRWEEVLAPILRVIEAEFTTPSTAGNQVDSGAAAAQAAVDVRGTDVAPRGNAFDRAWRELRGLHLDVRDDVNRLLAAASSPDAASRQVAARVLIDADPDTAIGAWRTLLDDPSRTVRRATVDAMVDAERPALRPLLERALADADAWTRWKALRGLVEVGIDPSRDALTRLANDADFRVRLEAAAALRSRGDVLPEP